MELSFSGFCSIANNLKGLSPVAANFKLRKFYCKIAKKKKMKVKLTAEIFYIFMQWKWLAGRNTKLSFVILSSPASDFEHVVLETSLASIVNKFNRLDKKIFL